MRVSTGSSPRQHVVFAFALDHRTSGLRSADVTPSNLGGQLDSSLCKQAPERHLRLHIESSVQRTRDLALLVRSC